MKILIKKDKTKSVTITPQLSVIKPLEYPHRYELINSPLILDKILSFHSCGSVCVRVRVHAWRTRLPICSKVRCEATHVHHRSPPQQSTRFWHERNRGETLPRQPANRRAQGQGRRLQRPINRMPFFLLERTSAYESAFCV